MSSYLINFFHWFSSALLDMCGMDTTVSCPEPVITLAAQAAFGHGSSASLLSLNVASHPLVIESPVATAYMPLGYATHGSRAWDVMNQRMVYLKDLWRVILKWRVSSILFWWNAELRILQTALHQVTLQMLTITPPKHSFTWNVHGLVILPV